MADNRSTLILRYVAALQAVHGPRWPDAAARQIAANAPPALALAAQLNALRRP